MTEVVRGKSRGLRHEVISPTGMTSVYPPIPMQERRQHTQVKTDFFSDVVRQGTGRQLTLALAEAEGFIDTSSLGL